MPDRELTSAIKPGFHYQTLTTVTRMFKLTESFKQPYRLLRNYKLRLTSILKRHGSYHDYRIFCCNICGKVSHSPFIDIKAREQPSCYHCGSTLRFRSIIAALSSRLLGEVIPLVDFPINHSIRGLGMSDALLYARHLEKKFNYSNTFYHQSPFLDITDPASELAGQADFIISSDVFEHVPPPIGIAFDNLYKLLDENGVVIFSVPLNNSGETVEHFPELHDYRITKRRGRKILINTTIDGRTQVFDKLQFHGGCGATLEMRVFSKQSVLEEIRKAGFHDILIHDSNYPEFGIIQDSIESPVISMLRR